MYTYLSYFESFIKGYMTEIMTAGFAVFLIFFLWVLLNRVHRNRISSIRNASLTVEELEDHARRMAMEHSVSSKRTRLKWPMGRLNENYTFIRSVYKDLNDDAVNKRTVPPAAEWLLDNFYVVEEQVKNIRVDLVKKDYNRLPVLRNGPYKGYTRVFAIATELVAHMDGHIEEGTLLKYLEAYQTHSILFDREIWLIPTMIRIALIENIRSICEKIDETQKQWNIADEIVETWWSDEFVDGENIIRLFKSNIEGVSEANPSFVEHLFYRLRRSGRSYSNVLRYIDENLDKFGTTTEILAQKEHNAQAVSTVSMGNAIVSLKYVSSLNWVNLFESASYVERILKQDPHGTYTSMDIYSRNYYRGQIEKLAKNYGVSELHIAREAIALAQKAYSETSGEFADESLICRRCHVGYYLVDKGIKDLENSQKGNKKAPAKLTNWLKDRQGMLYILSIGALTLLISAVPMGYVRGFSGWKGFAAAMLVGAAVIIPSSEMAIAILNWVVCRIKRPAVFPRLELKDGIPSELSTMVVIPALLTDEKRVQELLENMENHYLANREDNLSFALIGAFKDSEEPNTDNGHHVLVEAFEGVKALNVKYAPEGTDRFYFYHRLSQYNEVDNNWTGWERKRGALMEFNEMLLGSLDTSITFYSNAVLPAPTIKYIITLDADTVLPLGMAKRMVGTMAHPLNTPIIDPVRGIVVDGHGLMQPRISFDIDSSNRSVFSRIFTGQEGIDPYASAISDVYQDLFGEGIFTGKGIYDLRIFQQVLKNAVPENAILSHDLLEGSYVRAALVTDLELVDSYPSKYNSYIARLHRWIRGDWQLIPWLGRKITDKNGNRIKNPLTFISMWKIMDNLRRSLVAPAIIVVIFMGFSLLPGSSYFWTGFGVAALLLPLAINIIGRVSSGGLKPERVKRHIPGFFGLKASLFQFLLTLVFLPYHALIVLEAVSVTLIRVLITKKNMLEWVTSADAEKGQSNSLKSYITSMGVSSLEGIAVAALALLFKPEDVVLSLIFLVMWGLAPYIAWMISRDYESGTVTLKSADLMDLRRIARKTWRYFEEFSNQKNNYLVPDNYQEDPPRGIAFRTSPTNIGLGLLASLSGRDMGYAGILATVESIRRAIDSIEKLDKWNGHLYNWYDTRTLKPLTPRYVSTVDSGNFVSYLITLDQGLKEYAVRPLIDLSCIQGIEDTLQNGLEAGETLPADLSCFDFLKGGGPISLLQWYQGLTQLIEWNVFITIKRQNWKTKVEQLGIQHKQELLKFAPWIPMIPEVPAELLGGTLQESTQSLLVYLDTNHRLNDYGNAARDIVDRVDTLIEEIMLIEGSSHAQGLIWLKGLREAAVKAGAFSDGFMKQFEDVQHRIGSLSENTRFGVLYDDRRQLFSIGFNIEDNRLTNSYYDLLASEARQTSYLAIARGEVPPKHWFMLGRSLTVVDRFKGLVSWSGTMFEYLMPLLIMRSYHNTLLDETYSFVIKSQMKYGKQRGMPWGTSESSYNALDINLDYQYKAIGVPWLGLKRGLIEDAVAAPYATFLALMVSPLDAFENIKYLKAEGMEGPYGFYEAADYTQERLSFEPKRVIVKSYMAHHQGMSLMALNNYLNQNIMQRRFFADPTVKAARLLLQERVPLNVVFTKENKEKIMPFKGTVYKDKGSYRRFTEMDSAIPKAQILSNGIYSVMVTDRGTGYSRTKTMAVSRWREDSIADSYGMFFYIKNTDKNLSWSSAYAPLNVMPESYEAVFTADKAVYRRVDGDIETTTEIAVASGDNAEIRRVQLKNSGDEACTMEITSYFELVMAEHRSDLAHPAFSNLFVSTEFDPKHGALLAHRRPRSEGEKGMWIAQIPVSNGEAVGELQYETDRMQFIGRGHTVSNPACIEREKPLTNTVGSVLDPIFSLRLRVKIEPGKSARISFVTVMADGRDALIDLIEKYRNPEICDAAFWLALTRSQVETKYLNIKAQDMELYQDMISSILFNSPLRRSAESMIRQNHKGQSGLWAYGISGDRPIILVCLNKVEDTEILFEVLKAHEYWRLKDLKVDLVIVCQEDNNYMNPLYALTTEVVFASQTHDVFNRQGDVFILNINNMAAEDINLLSASARMIFRGSDGTMGKQQRMPNRHEPRHIEKSEGEQ